MQVVTSENFQQLVETGKVPEYKPPAEAIAKAADAAVVVDPAKEQPRGEDGKFVAKDAEVKADKVDTAEKAADDEDAEDADLPERVRKQIGKKHRAMKEAEEFARTTYSDLTAERQRADALQREIEALKGTKSQAQPEKDPKEPNQDDFKTVGDYTEALAEYKVEKKFAEREAKQERERQEQAAAQAQAELNSAIGKVAKEFPDYAEVIADCDIDMPPHITVYLATNGEAGVRLGYHFAKPENRAEYDRIAKLSPIRAIAELGKLEDRLEKPKAKDEPKGSDATAREVSRAPSPITPLNGTATPVTKDPSQMTLQELKAYEASKRASRAAVR
jgi:broad specificity phosphatase PhoE